MTQLSSALTPRVPGACVQCTRSPWHWGGCSPLPPVIPLPRPTSRPAPTLPGSLVLTPLCCLVSCTDGIDRLFSTSPREQRSFPPPGPCVTGEDLKGPGVFQTGFLGRALSSSTASLGAAPRAGEGDRRRDLRSLPHLDLCYILECCVKLCFDKGFGRQN